MILYIILIFNFEDEENQTFLWMYLFNYGIHLGTEREKVEKRKGSIKVSAVGETRGQFMS